MKQLVNDAKALRTLRKTPAILQTLLRNVTPEQAAQRADAGGWTVLVVLRHMRDVEAIFTQRARDLLDRPNPVFSVVSNEELLRRNGDDTQDMDAVLATYLERRQALIALLESLSDEQWRLAGTHPEQGPATMLDVAVNGGLHDIDHIEQIIGMRERRAGF